MKRFLNSTLILVMALSISVTLTACGYNNSDTIKLAELSFNNNSAKIQYSPAKWRTIDTPNGGTMIQIKSEKAAVAIGAGRVPSSLNQDEFVSDFKKFMTSKSIDGNIEEGRLNDYPLLIYTERKGQVDITFAVAVVKDGDGYYELTFGCLKDLFPKYKDAAFTVMQTFQVVNPSGTGTISQNTYSDKLKEINNTPLSYNKTSSDDERIAIKTLVQMFNAYGEQNIEKLKSLDLRAKHMSNQAISELFRREGGSNWVVHYVEITSANSQNINGKFMYSYEVQRKDNLGAKNINLSLTNFILEKTENGWMLASTSSYNGGETDLKRMELLLSLQTKGKEKYGTENLANWSGLNQ